MLYFLKFQKNTNGLSQAWSPSAKKLDKKAVFSPYCGDKAIIYMTDLIKMYAACLWGNTPLHHGEDILLIRYPYWSVEEMSAAFLHETRQKL